MQTYLLERGGSKPLYEQLYEHIRADILAGRIAGGEKLPPKRALAEHLGISKITVETAYAQLLAEGYLSSRERSGYYAESMAAAPATAGSGVPVMPQKGFEGSDAPERNEDRTGPGLFPYSVWARLMRAVILEEKDRMLRPVPPAGSPALCRAISGELYREKGMSVSPGQVIIGAGTEYFYTLLTQFLGRHRRYAVEDPSHRKIALAYRGSGAHVAPVRTDEKGMSPEALRNSGASVAHLSPSHHYPTGVVMPITRRRELAAWLGEEGDRFIIEDDYDSEFSYLTRPAASMQSLDTTGRLIYLNTFSKTIAPTLRISYMILPLPLLEDWQRKMGFYSCAVPSFEQLTLARFLEEGYYERHLRRTKKHYAQIRGGIMELLQSEPLRHSFLARQSEAGLHFILVCKNEKKRGESLRRALAEAELGFPLLSDFYFRTPDEEAERSVVIQYSQISKEKLGASLLKLAELLS